jgi:hypothetical protein
MNNLESLTIIWRGTVTSMISSLVTNVPPATVPIRPYFADVMIRPPLDSSSDTIRARVTF